MCTVEVLKHMCNFSDKFASIVRGMKVHLAKALVSGDL